MGALQVFGVSGVGAKQCFFIVLFATLLNQRFVVSTSQTYPRKVIERPESFFSVLFGHQFTQAVYLREHFIILCHAEH